MQIMSNRIFVKYVCNLLFLLLAVESQRIIFPSPDEDDGSDCNCIPIRSCPSLRNRKDWKISGETCGSGYRENRMVCCPSPVMPDVNDADPIPVTTVPIPVDTVPVPVDTIPITDDAGPNPDNAVRPLVPPPSLQEKTKVCGVSNYGGDPFQPLIMGGENAREGQWPWMAAIRMRESTGEYVPWCSGFLIDSRHVLSAAHCYGTKDDDLYRARVGSINQNEADEYRVIRITIPDGYTDGRFYDDIALLTLDREVNFPTFNPICLPNDQLSKMNLNGKGLTIAGWGTDRMGGDQKVVLQYLSQIPVIPNPECHRALRQALRNSFQRQFPRGITKGFICAGFKEAGKSACGGDSGGPQMIVSGNRWYAVGIVSFGIRCGVPGMPAGSTRVSSYIDWIRENSRE